MNKRSYRLGRRRKAKTAPLVPLDEQRYAGHAPPVEVGVLRQAAETLHAPDSIELEKHASGWVPDPVVAVITGLSIVWIAIIAWLISRQP